MNCQVPEGYMQINFVRISYLILSNLKKLISYSSYFYIWNIKNIL